MLYLIYKVGKFIMDQFNKPNKSGLEYYITSKKPQTTSDVERLTREYENRRALT